MTEKIATPVALIVTVGLLVWAAARPSPWRPIVSYRTGLVGRTDGQIHNARLAAESINGTILQPGAVFSFNRIVGLWTADRGYVKAPVSYDGELIRSWGGGVCQTSTTLYNAALITGLEIVERHRHQFPPRYAPPGQDAAVAYDDIDLRFRNPYHWPLKIEATVESDWIVCRVLSQKPLGTSFSVERELRQVTPPTEVTWLHAADPSQAIRWRVVNRGLPGIRVAVYRRATSGRTSTRILISEDTYPPINRLVRGE